VTLIVIAALKPLQHNVSFWHQPCVNLVIGISNHVMENQNFMFEITTRSNEL
jgi:hypothetical protein